MSLFQALCLLLFNDNNEIVLQDIQDATKIGLFCRSMTCTHCISVITDCWLYTGHPVGYSHIRVIPREANMKSASDGCGFWLASSHPYNILTYAYVQF